MFMTLFYQLHYTNIDRVNGKLIITLLTAFFTVIVLNMGCKNPITDPGPQPSHLEDVQHIPMLNIFGILRPGNENGMPLSYVHLEESFPFSTYPDDIEVYNAEVKLYLYEDYSIADSVSFIHTDFNSTMPTSEYRNQQFFPEARQTYGIICRKEGYPVLTSQTTVPSIPIIALNSLTITETEITFTIVRDSLAALYDIYLRIGEREYSARDRRPESGNTEVLIKYDKADDIVGELKIFAYDLNLSEYMTYNISIKPNTYKLPYSTVKNGYGSFGSLNYLKKVINF